MQTTLAHMLSMIEKPTGKKASRDRQALVDMANRIRQVFYNLYKELDFEVDATECFQTQWFKACHGCPRGYFGVTLPPHMMTVEAAWKSGQPLDLYTKWREAKVGIRPSGDCLLASYDVPGRFPTEREICAENGSYVAVTTDNIADNSKEVEIIYIDPSGRQRRESLQLTAGQPIATTDIATDIKSVVLPSGRQGIITLKERCTGRVLSEYMPFELVPSYRRIKITGLCGSDTVLVTANRQFLPVYYDTDIVETDNSEAIINAALYLFYSDSGAEGGLIQKAGFHKNEMKEALKGEASRALGVNRENDTGRFGPPVMRSRLRRNRGGHNIPI